jgi:hypothetical protein
MEYLTQNPNSQQKFDELLASLASKEFGVLTDLDENDPDGSDWNAILHSIPLHQRNWLDSPWIIAEFYFYRRLMNIFPYEMTSYDLFHQQKLNGLLSSLPHFEDVAMAWMQSDTPIPPIKVCLQFGVLTSLWGNKNDLSLWPATLTDHSCSNGRPSVPPLATIVESILSNTASQILDNDLEEIVHYLMSSPLPRSEESRSIGIILDNAGYELLGDLFFGYCLIALQIVDQIVFYTKKHPTFVSDATTRDSLDTVQMLSELPSSENRFPFCRKMGLEWKELVEKGIFVFSDDYFWCQPVGFRYLPPRIQSQLKVHLVTFIKVAVAPFHPHS